MIVSSVSLFSTRLSPGCYLVLFSAINFVSTSDGARQISLSEGTTIVEDDNASREDERVEGNKTFSYKVLIFVCGEEKIN